MIKLGFAVALAATVGIVALGQPAGAQGTCEWYAKTALEQQKANIDRKCGLTGPEWSSDRASHMLWCSGVGPDQWKKQAQLREQALATKCRPAK